MYLFINLSSGLQGMDRSFSRVIAAVSAITILIAFVATVAEYKDGQDNLELAERQILSDQNQFESAPAWDANWDIDEFRHHFVQTERQQTEINKKRDQVIAHLDSEVEVNLRFEEICVGC